MRYSGLCLLAALMFGLGGCGTSDNSEEQTTDSTSMDAGAKTDVASGEDDTLQPVSDVPEDIGTEPDTERDVGDEPDIPLLCEPNSYQCADESQPQRCRSDGMVWEDMQRCLAGEICVPNAVGCAEICDPPAVRCASDAIEWYCTDEGYFAQRICPEDSPSCFAAGHCIQCDPGDRYCTDEGLLATCRSDGSDWDYEPCSAGSFCDADECVACEQRCLTSMVMTTCDALGNETSEACSEQAGEQCYEGVGCAPCLAGDRRCTDDGLPEFCAPDNSVWLETVACRENEACHTGICRPCPAEGNTCADSSFLLSCPADGPNVAMACDADEICAQGQCHPAACAAEVILLMDRSGSMSSSWQAVENSVEALIASRADVRFGFLAFPGLSGAPTDLPPVFPETRAERETWFQEHSPGGGTPLNEAVILVAKEAYNVWSLTNPLLNHFLIVLSDGEGQGCADHDFPIPNPTEDCTVDGLAAASALLYSARDVRTVAIGFNYGGSPEQLLALTDNGGMSEDGFYEAGDEATLTTALEALFVDPKFCL